MYGAPYYEHRYLLEHLDAGRLQYYSMVEEIKYLKEDAVIGITSNTTHIEATRTALNIKTNRGE